MAQTISNVQGAGALIKAPASGITRRLAIDKFASRFIALGGWIILLVICAIIIVILGEALPLFGSAKISPPISHQIDSSAVSRTVLADEYLDQLVIVDSTFSVHHLNLSKQERNKKVLLATDGRLDAAGDTTDQNSAPRLTAVYQQESDWYLGDALGRAYQFKPQFTNRFVDGVRVTESSFQITPPIVLIPDSLPILGMAAAHTRNGQIFAGYSNGANLHLLFRQESRGLLGPGPVKDTALSKQLPLAGNLVALAIDVRGDVLVAGTDRGELIALSVKSAEQVEMSEVLSLDRPITALQYALGGRTIIVGQADGQISTWQILRSNAGQSQQGLAFQKLNQFESQASSIKLLVPSLRNKVFLSLTADNQITVHYATTGKTLAVTTAELAQNQSIAALNLSPKGDVMLAATTNGQLLTFKLDNPHPEISLRALFGQVHYEGYPEAEHVWQSTGGTDTFEPKLGLVPLIFGTLKGAFYALFFSLPLAILAAIYTSLFMPPRMKSIVKPILEMMAALPSVVIGFIAGLWLAPVLEPHLLAIIVIPILVCVGLVVACLLTWAVRRRFNMVAKQGSELYLVLPFIVIFAVLAFYFSGYLEQVFFAGNLKVWLYDNFAINVDQRNSIIAGIAVGFAVIPIIFTISEDCITSVPRTLTAGGLALGATRWQTAVKVVLPVAAPGIFAAVMIGIGRAVGETMIVLMATGNTPLLDPSIFTGFRALSANIAVELPEAPHGGTLYRILFLTAFILFVMTFILNALSELVRMRLRKRLGGAH